MRLSLPKELLVRIGGSSAGLERAGSQSQAVLNRVGQAAKNVTRSVAGIAATAAGIGFATKRLFIDPFGAQQDALASLNQALASTGKVGEDALGRIADEAARLQRLTRFGDEALIQASASLATLAPALNAPELARAQTIIAAIADTFLKGDLAQAGLLLGKTIGSTTNALSRYGIEVDTSASASEKLAQILGSSSLAAAFDVAQAKAQTWQGRIAQAANAAGDLRETIGEIIVTSLGLTDQTANMADRIAELNDRIEANSAKWVAWGRVVVEAVKFAAQVFAGLVRVFFNIGQMIGRAMDIVVMTVIGGVLEAWEGAKRVANRIPGVHFDLREGPNPFLAAAGAQTDALKGDLGDIADAVLDIADAWLDVQDAADKARQATGKIASTLPAAAPGVGPNPVLGARIQSMLAGSLGPASLVGVGITGPGGVRMPEVVGPAYRATREAAAGFSAAADVVVDGFARIADAAVTSSAQLEVAIIGAIQNVVANIRTQSGDLFGSTLLGGVIGAGLGIVGSLFGRDRGPMPVRVADYDSRALDKLKEVQKAANVTNIIELPDGTLLSVDRVTAEQYDRQRRDGLVRYGARGSSLKGR